MRVLNPSPYLDPWLQLPQQPEGGASHHPLPKESSGALALLTSPLEGQVPPVCPPRPHLPSCLSGPAVKLNDWRLWYEPLEALLGGAAHLLPNGSLSGVFVTLGHSQLSAYSLWTFPGPRSPCSTFFQPSINALFVSKVLL